MTRSQIKDTALRLFAELGYEGTSMSSIAIEVGIKTPSIYAHFPSKEALLWEVWSDLVNDYSSYMNNLVAWESELPVGEQLEIIIKSYGQYFLRSPVKYNLWSRMLMFPPPEFKARILADTVMAEQQLFKRVQELLAQGVDRREIIPAGLAELANAFCVIKEGYVIWLMFYQPYLEDKSGENLLKLLWQGIGMPDRP